MFGLAGLSLALGFAAAAHSSVAMPACSATEIRPLVSSNGMTGRVLLSAALRNTGGHDCFAHGRLVLTLRDSKSHRLLRISGNPHAARISRRLHPGRNAIFSLLWSNYCGPGRPLLVNASYGGRAAIERHNYPGAACTRPGAPSALEIFRLSG
jgi:hypothetical protein